jgi:hypothetical protein
MPAVHAQLWPPGNTHGVRTSASSPIGFVGVVQRDPLVAGLGPARAGAVIAARRCRYRHIIRLESAGSLPRVKGQKMAKRTTNLIPMRRGYRSSDA